jgi:integrase
MPSHLHRRGAVYYTRLVVPPRLRSIIGRSDLGCSLGVKDLAEAKRRLPIWLLEAQATLAAAEAKLAASETAPPMGARLSPEARWSRAQFEYEEELAAIQMQEAFEEAELLEQAEALEQRLKQSDTPLTPAERAADFLIRDMAEQRDGYRRRYRRRKFGNNRDTESSATPAVAMVDSSKADRSKATILGIFEGYAGQDGSNPETVKQFRAILKHLIAFLGHDDADRVTHADLVRWREFLLVEPVKDGKPRAAKTINDSYLSAVSTTFRYGRNQLLVATNPTAELAKVRSSNTPALRERDFNKVEQRIILEAALVPAGGKLSPERVFARRWVPWLCAYTGARVNEMTQLRRQDVNEIEGVWTIRITPEAGNVKNKQARTVPLHEHLIEQGFLAAIRDKQGPLFYNPGNARGEGGRGQHKKVGMFLANWVRSELGITDPDIMPNHAWRHTFKTIYQEVGIEERAADYIQGHASKGQGRRYGANTIAGLAAQMLKFPRFNWRG